MATIKSSLVLNDRMSGVLQKINSSMGLLVEGYESVQAAAGQSFDPSKMNQVRQACGQIDAELEEIENDYKRMASGQDTFNKKLAQGKNEAGALMSKIKGAVGAYVGFSAIKMVVGKAVEYASDLQEVQNVVDVTFGKSSKTVNKWAENTLYLYGLSELAAKQYAGTMGAMLKSSGVAGKAVDSMSMKIAELAGDMASFYNLETDEAFAKIRSGISGETEPLKQLGVNMNVANLEAYALSQGIKESYNEMSQAEQVLLRYNYLLSVTSDAQGDFARTSDSYSNQVKLLKANWQDFTGELAQSALPLLASGLKVLNNGIQGLSENWSVISPIVVGLVALVGAYTAALAVHKAVLIGTAIAKGIGTVVEYVYAKSVLKSAEAAGIKTAGLTVETAATAGLTTATGAAVGAEAAFQIATAQSTVAQASFNTTLLACPITWIVIAIIALIAALVALCNWFAKTQGISTDCFGAIVGGIYVVGATFKNLGMLVANIFLGIWNAGSAVCANIETAFNNSIANVKSFFYSLASTALNVIGRIAEGLNSLPFVEIDYQGIYGKANEFAVKAEEAQGTKGEYQDVSAAFTAGYNTFDAFADGWAKDAFAQGANAYNAWKAAKGSDKTDKETDLESLMNEIAGNTGSTAGSTGSIADSLDKTNEELEWIRDMAEREVINRFTTADVKVDFTGMTNHISNDMDLDGVISGFVGKFKESLQTAAQGVY